MRSAGFDEAFGSNLEKPQSSLLLTLLAGLVVFYAAYAGWRWMERRRTLDETVTKVLTEMRRQTAQLAHAIDQYNQQYGFYPPAPLPATQSRGRLNPLFYELVGTRHDPKRQKFFDPTQKEPIGVAEMEKTFGMSCFSNTLPFPTWPKDFLSDKELSKKALEETDLWGVGFNETGLIPDEVLADFHLSPWRYLTSPAEHNPGRFDLWIQLEVQGKQYQAGNWPEAP